jgi:protoporphyrinogen oxidase
MSLKSERWGVVGGGLLGMILAHRLAEDGKRVVLYEGGASLGGLAGAWQLGEWVWDKHYHATRMSDGSLRNLLEELGLADEMEWVPAQTGLYADGQLHSVPGSSILGYTRGGYARILERFSKVLLDEGVLIRRAYKAQCVESRANGVLVEFENGKQKVVDQVVVTLGGPASANICPALTTDERERWQSLRYLGIISAALILKRPLAALHVTKISDERIPFTAAIEMSALVDRSTFGGNSLVYLPMCVSAGDPAFQKTDRDIEADCLSALSKMYPHFDSRDILCFRVSRVRHLSALRTLNFSEIPPPITTSIPGVHIVNSAYLVSDTVHLDKIVELANGAAQPLLKEGVQQARVTAGTT